MYYIKTNRSSIASDGTEVHLWVKQLINASIHLETWFGIILLWAQQKTTCIHSYCRERERPWSERSCSPDRLTTWTTWWSAIFINYFTHADSFSSLLSSPNRVATKRMKSSNAKVQKRARLCPQQIRVWRLSSSWIKVAQNASLCSSSASPPP